MKKDIAMTNDEKAKAYDEALEMARQIHNGNPSSGTAIVVCEQIFPELRESEDERIRKWIVEELEITRDAMSGKNDYSDDPDIIARLKRLDEALFWLEKQKELMPPVNVDPCDASWYAYYQRGLNKGYELGLEAGRKEQKPILEVFGFKVGDAVRLKDGDGRKHIIKSFEEVEGVHGPNFYHVEFEDNSARDGIYPGEEYPNGYYTQMEKFEDQKPNPTEDMPYVADEHFFEREPADSFKYRLAEYMTKNCKKGEGPYGYSYNISSESILQMAKEELIKRGDLKEQKPVEGKEYFSPECGTTAWSEKDKKTINDACCFLGEYAGYIGSKNWGKSSTLFSIVDKLKSLRPCPSWKPSEEQMDALNKARRFIPYNCDILESLYEQLKKL